MVRYTTRLCLAAIAGLLLSFAGSASAQTVRLDVDCFHPFSAVPGIGLSYDFGKWSAGLRSTFDYFARPGNSFMIHINDFSVETERAFPIDGPVDSEWFLFGAAHAGWYDLQLTRESGRQGEYAALGAGAGIRRHLGRNTSLSFVFAAGPAYTVYRAYRPEYDMQYLVYKNTRGRWSVIPTDVRLLFSWNLPLKSADR